MDKTENSVIMELERFIYNTLRIIDIFTTIDKYTLRLIIFIMSVIVCWSFILGIIFSLIFFKP